VAVHHFAVRISRDWINGVIERGPFLRGLPVSEVQIDFNERNKNQIIVWITAKGLPVKVTALIGIQNNQVMVALEDIRIGPLPVPCWVKNMVMGFLNIADKVNRPGVTFDRGVTRVDVLKLSPIPLKLRFNRFETAGRYILIEGGEV